MDKNIVIIKGAGDIASAIAHKLFHCGFKIVMTEIEKPTCLRRYVSFANCIYEGEWQVEGVRAKKANNYNEVQAAWRDDSIAVIIDQECKIKKDLEANVLIDGILAKRNTGTEIGDAPLVIGLGPGFTAGKDVDFVIETNRGHNLGKIIEEGTAEADTGTPGNIKGYTKERVLRSLNSGQVRHIRKLGDLVEKGDLIARIGDGEVTATITGVLRGLVYEGLYVPEGFKIGDIDPRSNVEWIYTISDKGRCIAGGVLEAVMMWKNRRGE